MKPFMILRLDKRASKPHWKQVPNQKLKEQVAFKSIIDYFLKYDSEFFAGVIMNLEYAFYRVVFVDMDAPIEYSEEVA